MSKHDFSTYQSPFTYRYGSEEMRKIFSEENKYRLWRKIWVALAEAQHESGLLTKQEFEDIKKHEANIDIKRIQEIEKETKHDVVSAIREFSEKAKVGGGKIHLGATSMDIRNNQDMMQIMEGLQIIEKKLKTILKEFAQKIQKYADLTCLGYTHLQPAEPTTVGYRLSFYAQDLLIDFELLQFVKKIIKAKGIKGAVGTAASYQNLGVVPQELEKKVMQKLGLEAALITSQIYTHTYDFLVLTVLNSIAMSLGKFAADLRILQSPHFGEWSEPFGSKQVGSSAMPFKKNPISSEKICSLARFVAVLPQVAAGNAAHGYLERTLDDSANKRVIFPEGFLATDEILTVSQKILEGLVINEKRIAQNLEAYAPFAATEVLILEAVKEGANRQTMHELMREASLKAWAEIREGKPNPMKNLLTQNEDLTKYLKPEKINRLLDVSSHVGDAPERARTLTKKIKQAISS